MRTIAGSPGATDRARFPDVHAGIRRARGKQDRLPARHAGALAEFVGKRIHDAGARALTLCRASESSSSATCARPPRARRPPAPRSRRACRSRVPPAVRGRHVIRDRAVLRRPLPVDAALAGSSPRRHLPRVASNSRDSVARARLRPRRSRALAHLFLAAPATVLGVAPFGLKRLARACARRGLRGGWSSRSSNLPSVTASPSRTATSTIVSWLPRPIRCGRVRACRASPRNRRHSRRAPGSWQRESPAVDGSWLHSRPRPDGARPARPCSRIIAEQ